ncbi:hypothetical protein DFQ26_001947, partial [Actinomortierella ambigua]
TRSDTSRNKLSQEPKAQRFHVVEVMLTESPNRHNPVPKILKVDVTVQSKNYQYIP